MDKPPQVTPTPPGLLRDLADAQRAVARFRAEISDWRRNASNIRASQWVAWHDAHGWPPGEQEYEKSLRMKAGVR